MNNLQKTSYWNPYFVDTNRGGGFELNNIIIYNEDGILIETGCGWFSESNNHTEGNVNGGILKINTGTEEKHKKEKHNFIIKDNDCSYKDNVYTLYIYYKNVNYKPIAIVKNSLFIEVEYQLFNNENKKYSKAIGQSKKYSDAIYWDLRHEIKATDDDGFKYDRDMSGLHEHLKNIKKLIKKYEKTKEAEKDFPIDAFIDGTNTEKNSNNESYKNNKKMLEAKEGC